MADTLLYLHMLFVAFVVGALPAIWIGAYLRHRRVRSIVLRSAHLAAILFVTAESLLGIACPLTVWEDALRGNKSELGFVQRWVRELLFWDLPAWVFILLYCGFALLVIWTWVRIPPQRR